MKRSKASLLAFGGTAACAVIAGIALCPRCGAVMRAGVRPQARGRRNWVAVVRCHVPADPHDADSSTSPVRYVVVTKVADDVVVSDLHQESTRNAGFQEAGTLFS